MKLTLLTLLLCCYAQIFAQFSLNVDGGYAHTIFNDGQSSVMAPLILGSNVPTTQRVEIQTSARGFLGLALEYAPPAKTFAWELRLQYMSRGYDILIFEPAFGGLAFPFFSTRGDYLDVMPAMIYHFSPQFSLRAGPYASLVLYSKDEYFLSENTRRISRFDAGLNFGASLSSGRFHLRLDYQRSARSLTYPVYDINLTSAEFYDGSPVSSLRIGIGYTLVWPDRGLELVPERNQ